MKEKGETLPDPHQDLYSKTLLGFWIYLLTDFVLFGALFATYQVLRKSLFGGTAPATLFELPYALTQTLIFLVASFTAGMAGAYAHRREKAKTLLYFFITFILGGVFLGMMFGEFSRFIATGNIWTKSAFLSAYFTLVGTLGVHVIFALLWTIVLAIPVWKEGLSPTSVRRLTCLRMFWQFLNVVWIFIFTIVYLMGEVQ